MQIVNCTKIVYRSCLFALGIFAISNSAFANESSPYAQLSSFTTQVPGTKSKIAVLETVNGLSSITVDKSHTHVIVHESGTYSIAVSAQVGSLGANLAGNVQISLLRNGKTIPCAVARQTVDFPTSTYNVTTQAVMQLSEGDTVGVEIYSNLDSLGIISHKAKAGQHAIPSINFNIFKLANECH